eukprot:3956988-Lingulodinium_polyedra.AAC.1
MLSHVGPPASPSSPILNKKTSRLGVDPSSKHPSTRANVQLSDNRGRPDRRRRTNHGLEGMLC